MGLIDKIFGNDGNVNEEELAQAPLEQEAEQLIQQQEERIQELQQEVEKREKQESARTAKIEEQLQEQKQQNKELQQQLQSQQDQLQTVQESESSSATSRPPPDTDLLKDKPVVSSDGVKNFGKFKGWINEGGKIGIKCDHPKRDNKIEKVGWADNIRELVMDPNTLTEKDVIIVKLDGRGEKVDYVNTHKHKEVVQRKEKLEDKSQRLSMENDELIKQNRKLEQLNNKLITTRSMDRMESSPGNGHKDMVISKMANEQELQKQRMDNLAKQNTERRGRTDDVIQEYESAMDERFGNIGKSEIEESINDIGGVLGDFLGEMNYALEQLDPETREDVMNQLMGGGDGGSIEITDE